MWSTRLFILPTRHFIWPTDHFLYGQLITFYMGNTTFFMVNFRIFSVTTMFQDTCTSGVVSGLYKLSIKRGLASQKWPVHYVKLKVTMHRTQTQPTVAFEGAARLLWLETSQENATNTACCYSLTLIPGYCFRQYPHSTKIKMQ